jgi:rubredoxin
MSKYQCPECGYTFDEEVGDPHEGYAPGTTFEQLPDDFACPDCSVRFKEDFQKR